MQNSQHPKKRRGQYVVHKVMEATIEELAQVGFARLSIEEVAARAGVNKTTIYRRWKTKSQLVPDALSRIVEDMLNVPDTGTLRTDLIAFLRRAGAFLESSRGKAVLRVIVAEGADPMLLNISNTMLLQEERAVPRAIIERAIKRGELLPTTDSKLILFTIMGSLIHWVLIEHTPISDARIKRLVDLILFGATRGAPKHRKISPKK